MCVDQVRNIEVEKWLRDYICFPNDIVQDSKPN